VNYPSHWGSTTFESISSEIDKSGPASSEKFDYIEISSIDRDIKKIVDVKRISSEEASSRAKQHLKSGDLLISKVRPKLNGVAVVPDQYDGAIGTTGFYVVRSKAVSSKFLLYFTQTQDFVDSMDRKATGSSYPSVKISDIEEYKVPLPPNKEQERIVAKIEELSSKLNSGISELKDTKQRLELYKRAVLKAAMEGDFTEEFRKGRPENGAEFLNDILNHRRDKWEDEFQEVFKYSGKEYEEPEVADPPKKVDIPDTWTWGSINQISYVVGGLTKNKSEREEYDTEVPYLRVANVYANELDLEEIKSIRISEREEKTKMLQEGDLLVVEGNGSKSQIGRVAMWDGSLSPCSHQNHLIKVRVLPEVLRKFAVYWMLSPIGRKTIVDVASSTSGLHTLSITKVRSIPIPIPPAEEAKKIVEEIERRQTVADQILSDLENELNRSERLRQSILKQAFEGKLIPQNPMADSGDELLKSGDGKPEQGEQLKLSEVKSNVE
jgi:type I restriction enzyme S subunit